MEEIWCILIMVLYSKITSVIDTVSNYYKEENSNVHRGVHFLSGLTDKFEETRG